VRGFVRWISTVLILAGLMLIADAALTVAWQEPVSAFYANRTQNRLAKDLKEFEQAPLPPAQRRRLARLDRSRQIEYLARRTRRSAEDGQALGRIVIPKIGASYVVVQGTDAAALRKGPGHFPQTPLPGIPGTVAIAGHRTTYLAPFRRIDQLKHGDEIDVDMPYAKFRYAVERTRIVTPDSIWVIRRVNHDRLVLSACHPLYSAAKRIIVFARLVKTTPKGSLS
jgi:sortase A